MGGIILGLWIFLAALVLEHGITKSIDRLTEAVKEAAQAKGED